MSNLCSNYLYKLKEKNHFNLKFAIKEFIFNHNNKIHSITKYKPIDIKKITDDNVIKEVFENIINALGKKVDRNESDIF